MERAAKKQVLVVDDNHDAADTLAMLLEAEGCECRTAYSGGEALAAVDHHAPDLVILDLFMPHMSGDEVARRLREGPWGDHLVLVAHTAMSSHLHHQAILEAGFDHHLVKPASLDDLRALVRHDEADTLTLAHSAERRWPAHSH